MAIIIDTAGDCSAKKYIDCAFSGKYKALIVEGDASEEELKEAFDRIKSEFVDTADLYHTKIFELTGYIDSLDKRVQTIKRFIELQKLFIAEFGMPFLPGLHIAKRYNHNLYWDPNYPDVAGFLKKLDQIELKEAKFKTQVNAKVKELLELQKKTGDAKYGVLEDRKQFITMLNRLQQQRFYIDYEKTSMEAIALMVKDQRELNDAEKIKKQFKN